MAEDNPWKEASFEEYLQEYLHSPHHLKYLHSHIMFTLKAGAAQQIFYWERDCLGTPSAPFFPPGTFKNVVAKMVKSGNTFLCANFQLLWKVPSEISICAHLKLVSVSRR